MTLFVSALGGLRLFPRARARRASVTLLRQAEEYLSRLEKQGQLTSRTDPPGTKLLSRRRLYFTERISFVASHRRTAHLVRRKFCESGVDANFPHFDGKAMRSSKLLDLADVLLIKALH